MKSFILALAVMFGASIAYADEAPKTKKVCVMQKDAKTGKEKEVCKNVKVHKKHEGTAVPDGKKK